MTATSVGWSEYVPAIHMGFVNRLLLKTQSHAQREILCFRNLVLRQRVLRCPTSTAPGTGALPCTSRTCHTCSIETRMKLDFEQTVSAYFFTCALRAISTQWNNECWLQYHEPNCSPNITSARVEDGFACDTRANNLPPGKTTRTLRRGAANSLAIR